MNQTKPSYSPGQYVLILDSTYWGVVGLIAKQKKPGTYEVSFEQNPPITYKDTIIYITSIFLQDDEFIPLCAAGIALFKH